MTTTLIQRAIEFAVQAHAGDTRKHSPLPYVSHCFDVMKRVSSWGVDDPELLAAAMLHDTLEDTITTPQMLRGAFGQRILALVQSLTFPREASKRDKWNLLRDLPQLIPDVTTLGDVCLIKMSDRLCNTLDFMYEAMRKAATGTPADGYPARYGLLGFPVFDHWMRTSGDRLKNEPVLRADLQLWEKIVRDRYYSFRLGQTGCATVEAWLFS